LMAQALSCIFPETRSLTTSWSSWWLKKYIPSAHLPPFFLL
jgi:hypothetical protein